MDSHVTAPDLAYDREEFSVDGHNPKKSDTAQRKPPISPSVIALCSACPQPRWESEWKFNIEDGLPINHNDGNEKWCKTGDGMKGKAGKGKKLSRGMGRVFYHRQPRVVLVSP